MSIIKIDPRKNVRQNNKTTYDEVVNFFEDRGCELLSQPDEYENTTSKLVYRCVCGNVQEGRTFYYCYNKSFLCTECNKKRAIQQRAIECGHDYESIKAKLKEMGFSIIGRQDFYMGSDYIDFQCDTCHTVDKLKRNTILGKRYQGCKTCRANERRIANWQKYVVFAEEHGVKVIDGFSTFEGWISPITLKCKCGNEFTTTVNEMYKSNKLQCNECGLKLRSGENSVMWKGGVVSAEEKIRKSSSYAKWRKSVFERDGYKCMCCLDQSGGNIQAII